MIRQATRLGRWRLVAIELVAFVLLVPAVVLVDVPNAGAQADSKAEASVTITVNMVGEDQNGQLLSRMSVACEETVDPQYVDVVQVPSTVSFQVPMGALCWVNGTQARFGPMFGATPIAFAQSYPVLPITEDTVIGGQVGEDLSLPVHWLVVTRSGAQTGTRPANLQCETVRFEREVAYGAHKFTAPDGEECSWDIEHLPRFDVSFEQGPAQESLQPNSQRNWRSTVTSFIDGFEHPDENPTAFVKATIRSATGREATPAEVNYWLPTITSDPAQKGVLIDSLAADEQISGLTNQMSRLYEAYFDRSPDLSGLEYWRYLRSQDVPLLEVSVNFAASREFELRYGATSNNQFITLAYRNILKREPDAEGFTYWGGLMEEGLTGPELILYFAESEEYRNATRSLHRVQGVYRTLVGRVPTATEAEAALLDLEQTGGLTATANQLIGSADYLAFFDDHFRDIP